MLLIPCVNIVYRWMRLKNLLNIDNEVN